MKVKGKGTGKTGRPPSIEPVSLEHAREAMMAAMLAEDALIEAIQVAIASGNSAHQISKALGLSHQTVLNISARQTRTTRASPLNGSWRG